MVFILQGLSDDIHTVVKQSLVSVEKLFSILLDHRSQWFYKGDICMQPIVNQIDDLPIECSRFDSPTSLLKNILDKLPVVFNNKYWVIQNKYSHFVAIINYDSLEDIFGQDKGRAYKVNQHLSMKNKHNITNCFLQNRFISHLYAMLGDGDARIRNEAAAALFEFHTFQVARYNKATNKYSGAHLKVEFMAETLSNEIPFSLDCPLGTLTGFHPALGSGGADNRQLKKMLGKHLFDVTNMLFGLKSSEQLVTKYNW